MKNVTLLLACGIMSGCAVGRDVRPALYPLDAVWSEQDSVSDPAILRPAEITPQPARKDWWASFDDRTLTALIGQAIENNNDLKRMQARIKEAQASERVSDSTLFPQIDATASATRGTPGGISGDKPDESRRYGVSGSWEIDLFGGARRQAEAAEYAKQAAIFQRDHARLVLIEEVARNYLRLRTLQQQRALTQRNVTLQDETYRITREQRRERMVSQLEVLRARAQLRSTRAMLPQIEAEISAAINRLAVLTAQTPRSLRGLIEGDSTIPRIQEAIIVATPVETISRRPDIRAAERELAQATALTAAAFAEFFPKLTLEGFFGKSRSDIFGGLSPWNAALNGILPLLNFGRIQAGLDMADAREEQAFYRFRHTVLLAVEEVESSLSAYRTELERHRELSEAAREQREAASIAREQYKAGLIPQLDLLESQRNSLIAENEMIASEGRAMQNAIRLYTALGAANPPNDGESASRLINLP